MEYKKGSYIIQAQKEWSCCKCKNKILPKSHHFARVEDIAEKISEKTGNSYTEKRFDRFHISCAKTLDNLNDYEKKIIDKTNNLNETSLKNKINQILLRQENKGNLSFLRVITGKFNQNNKHYSIGRKGFSDFIIFLKGGKSLFIELKTTKYSYNNFQDKFKEKVSNLGYEYHIVHSASEMWSILNNNSIY